MFPRAAALLLLAARPATAAASCEGGSCKAEPDDPALLQFQAPASKVREEADWIIVGGGAAGCAAAAALADAGQDVLVLERGPSDKEIPTTQSAFGWPKAVNDASETFRFAEGVWGVAAKVLGGGSSLNGGLFFADRPEWFRRALPEVNYSQVFESYDYLKKQLATPVRDAGGPMAHDWAQALAQAGYGQANLSQPQMEWQTTPFVAYSTFNTSNPAVPRRGAAALLHDREGLPNLRVITGALVEKVLFNRGGRARAVRAQLPGVGRTSVKAKKGVVLAAGAMRTPQLLQLSGVGDETLLATLGVPVVAHSPSVGKNFTDRLVVALGVLSPQALNLSVGGVVAVAPEEDAYYELFGGGSVTSEFALTSLALVSPAKRIPALRAALATVFKLLPSAVLGQLNQMTQPIALQIDTLSRGSVKASSRDASAPPDVAARYFEKASDLENQSRRLLKLLELMRSEAMAPWTRGKAQVNDVLATLVRKFLPEEAMQALGCLLTKEEGSLAPMLSFPCLPYPLQGDGSAAAITAWLQQYIVSSYHYFGTAAAGEVVDGASFEVKGVKGLFVADASLLPIPTTVNPQATIMALGHYIGKVLAQQP